LLGCSLIEIFLFVEKKTKRGVRKFRRTRGRGAMGVVYQKGKEKKKRGNGLTRADCSRNSRTLSASPPGRKERRERGGGKKEEENRWKSWTMFPLFHSSCEKKGRGGRKKGKVKVTLTSVTIKIPEKERGGEKGRRAARHLFSLRCAYAMFTKGKKKGRRGENRVRHSSQD